MGSNEGLSRQKQRRSGEARSGCEVKSLRKECGWRRSLENQPCGSKSPTSKANSNANVKRYSISRFSPLAPCYLNLLTAASGATALTQISVPSS
jgi:hypothetical protein